MQAFLVDAPQLQNLIDLPNFRSKVPETVNFNADLQQLTDIGTIRNGVSGTVEIAGNPERVVNIKDLISQGKLDIALQQLTDI